MLMHNMADINVGPRISEMVLLASPIILFYLYAQLKIGDPSPGSLKVFENATE